MNYLALPNHFDGVSVRAVIEIPKGSQVRREVQNSSPNLFPCTKTHEIPFFANYGFIPSTLDGDGDCLDIYVIGDKLEAESVVVAYPRLCIDYMDCDGQDYKILSVLDPQTTDGEVMIVAEAICRAMWIQPTAIQDLEFAKQIITLLSVTDGD